MKKLLLLLLGIPFIMVSCVKHDTFPPKNKHFTVTIENVSKPEMYLGSGVINTPAGASKPGAIKAGDEYQFMVKAGKGQKLSFAVMLAATNDAFFGPDGNGIALYDKNGNPVSGDVTDQVYLWDAGTEVNEEPAVGPNTVTNQPTPNTGVDEHGVVKLLSQVTTDHFNYPTVKQVLRVWVKHMSGYNFMVTIKNVSQPNGLHTSKGDFPIPVSPGVWVISQGDNPLYTPGKPDRGQGIEAIAEDGNAANLGKYVAANTGIVYPLSPGAWAVQNQYKMPFFQTGTTDYGQGLEGLAEDGNPNKLGMSLTGKDGVESSGVFNTPLEASEAGPLGPGMKYQFSFKADYDDYLSLATMFVQSNDLFYSFGDKGISLFEKGQPISGDITSAVYLWDAGTEKNEEPGYGPNQVQRQDKPDTGIFESEPVDKVNDSFTYPAVSDNIKITISYN